MVKEVSIKILSPIASPATAPEMFVGIYYAHVEYSASAQKHCCSISPRSILGYRIYP